MFMSFFIINEELMKKIKLLLENIIEKSATGILIYAGKRLVDRCIKWWDEKKEEKRSNTG